MAATRGPVPDPIILTALISLAFLILACIRLTLPSDPFFDEVHYLPAARALLDNGEWLNREHPLMGKQLLALTIFSVGDTPLGWRMAPVLFGSLTLFAMMRAMWFATASRFAALAFGWLIATGFILFVQSRIAILDIFMAAFFAVALWQFAGAIRQPETARWRLVISGVAIGLSMGSKWNVVFLAMLPGLAFLVIRFFAGRRRLLLSQRGLPIPGMSLVEATLWLGVLPLFVYWLTFWPAYGAPNSPLEIGGFTALHSHIVDLQASVKQTHNYQSNWLDWTLNIRGIWYLYEPIDGAMRGIVLIGNPLTMLVGLPALAWCAWQGLVKKRWDALAIVTLYAVSVGMWMIVNKPVQFYYHYFLPSCFLLAALALALDALWQRGIRWIPAVVLIGSSALFAYFFPILSAAPLSDNTAFQQWMWLDSWR